MDKEIEKIISELEDLKVKYRSMCTFKIKSKEDINYIEHKKCLMCNGYSSTFECEDYVDIPHLIYFYKEFEK